MNTQPNPPPPFYKKEMFGVPPVPEYRGSDRKKLTKLDWAVRIVIIAIVLALVFVSWGVFKFIHGSPQPTPRPTPTSTQPAPQAVCPTFTIEGNPPSLTFCSPQFMGNAAGPVGSHIVLVGTNLSVSPTSWVVTTNKNISVGDFQKCLANTQFSNSGGCAQLSSPVVTTSLSSFLFSWTWTPPVFPKTIGDYYIAAEAGDASNPQIITSSHAFSVLASSPPCISITSGVGGNPDCSKQQSIPLSSGSTVTLSGSNWILGWAANNVQAKEDVEVIARCISCKRKTLFDIVISSSQIDLSKGNFSKSVKLLPGASGTYTVTAFDTVTPDVTPGGNFNTIASQSLTFGEPGDTTSLTINVS